MSQRSRVSIDIRPELEIGCLVPLAFLALVAALLRRR